TGPSPAQFEAAGALRPGAVAGCLRMGQSALRKNQRSVAALENKSCRRGRYPYASKLVLDKERMFVYNGVEQMS
ncbi:hypothetical protein ACFLWA_08385, partial [Chloroflexota bacterium]